MQGIFIATLVIYSFGACCCFRFLFLLMVVVILVGLEVLLLYLDAPPSLLLFKDHHYNVEE